MNIFCSNCQKDSGVEKTGRNGFDAAQAEDAGFKVKNFILYGIDEWVFVCSDECLNIVKTKLFTENKVSDEKKSEAKAFLDSMKAKIPQMSKEVCQKMGQLQKELRRRKMI